MKSYYLVLLASLIAALASKDGAYAQNLNDNAYTENEMAIAATNTFADEVNTTGADRSLISSKAIKDFAKAHKNISGESWDVISDGFRAKFTENGVTTSVYYSKKGYWSASLKNYSEAVMPATIRAIVKREYYDYTIQLVQEIETLESDGMPTYIVHVEDKDNYKMLVIRDGDMQIWKEFKKQQ